MQQLKTLTLKLTVKAGDNGKLFGAVTSKEIAEALKSQFNIVVDKKKVVIITDKEPDLENCNVYLSESLMENQIRLIVDSKYVLTGDFEDNIEATCLYSGQKNFVSLFKDAMRNEIELIKLRSKESDEN